MCFWRITGNQSIDRHMSRFVGRSAEKRFSTLCSDQQITCNEPREDDHGWDHIVEFPLNCVPGLPADLQPVIPPIFVQTKSHMIKGRRVTMKLSNALKLARSGSPCFVVLMNREADGTPTWHAVHFWESLITRVFKRALELNRKGVDEDRLHDHNFSFTMKKSDARTDEDLLPWMRRTVASIGSDYTAAKRSGRQAFELVGSISFAPPTSIDELVDHSLGLTPLIPIASVSISEKRFGVEFPLPVPSGPPTFASMQALPSRQCDIRMQGPDGKVLECVGDVIVPGIPDLDEAHRKVRVRASFFDIIWVIDGPAELRPNLDFALRRVPKELEDLIRFVSWCGQGEIDVRITVDDQPLLFASAQLNDNKDQPKFAWLLPHAETITRLSNHLKLKIPRVSVEEIWRSQDLANLHGIHTTTELRAALIPAEGQDFPNIETAVGSFFAEVGGWIFGLIQRFPVKKLLREGERVSIQLGVPTLLECYAFEPSDESALDRTEADFQRHAHKQGIFGMQNMHAILNQANA